MENLERERCSVETELTRVRGPRALHLFFLSLNALSPDGLVAHCFSSFRSCLKCSSLLWLCNLEWNTPDPHYFLLFCVIFWHNVCLCLCPSSRMEVLWEQEIWTALFSTAVSTPSRGTSAWYAVSQHVSTSRKKWRPAHRQGQTFHDVICYENNFLL